MTKLEELYNNNIKLMQKANITFEKWQHEPILDYTTDSRLARELGWTAAPTKSLFLKLKNGAHCLLLTHRDQRLNSKIIKNITGKRVSICNNEEMMEKIHCQPGAVCPFCLPDNIIIIIDPIIYNYPKLMYTPGMPEYTFAFNSNDLDKILSQLNNEILVLPKE